MSNTERIITLRSSFYSAASILINGFSSFFIYKVVANAFGPLGVTLLSHFQNLIGIFIGVSNDGLNRGLLAKIKSDYASRANIFLQTGLLNIAWWLVAGILYLCFRDYFEKEFIHTFYGHWAVYLWLGVLLMILQNQLFQTALATRGVGVYALYSISSAVVLAVSMFYVAQWHDFQAVLLVYTLTPLIVFFLAALTYRQSFSSFRSLKNIYDLHGFKDLTKFGLMALAIVLMGRLSSFVIREFAMDHFGEVHTGLWQAAVKVSDGYSAVFTAIINLIYLPKIAEAINNPVKLRKVVKIHGSLIILIAFAGLLLLWFIQVPVLKLLYNDTFTGASAFLNIILLKDGLRFTAWIFSYILFSQAKLKYFLLFEAVSAIIYVVFSIVWADRYAVMAPVYAELLAIIVFLILYLVYFRKLWFPSRS